MEFKVLGPLEITDGPRVVDVSAPKQRSLLAVLLLSANQVVSLDALMDQLWGERPPPQAAGALQAYISHVRKALEPNRAPRAPASVLISRPPGYLLAVDPSGYDAARYEAALEAARGRLADGDPAAARRDLDAGLALWRGSALAEFAYEDFARAEAARLDDLRIVGLELRAETDLALGRPAAAVGELERLVADHPLRERLWALLMLALYRSDRQSDALRAYQLCRTTLGEELGIEPGPALRQLEAAILAQSPDLDGQPSVARPEPVPSPPMRSSPHATHPPAAPAGPVFAGRAEPLARLGQAWARAVKGAGCVVVVSGEAGIGKTRLLEELAARVEQQGAAVAWGRGQEGDVAPAFWPWTQVVRGLVQSRFGGDVGSAAAAAGLAPHRLAPVVADEADTAVAPGAGESPTEARFRLYQAVAELLVAVAAEAPLLVVLDDLQWADQASLHLLEHVLPQLAGVALLVVVTYREADIAVARPLADALAAMARGPVLDRLRLEGLSDAELHSLIAEATGSGPSPQLVAVVRSRTNGNPFFATELVRLLESEHRLDDPAAAERTAVPTGVLDVVRRRLLRLPEQTNAVLVVASVVGHEFDVSILEAVTGLDEDLALDAVELALVTGLVSEVVGRPGRFHFRHALVRQSIHDGLSELRRARLHARIAEALDQAPGRDTDAVIAEVAGHLVAAGGTVEPARTVQALLRAAEVAQRHLAYEQAEAQLRRALELLPAMPPGPDRDGHERTARARLGVLLSWLHGHAAAEVTGAFVRASELGSGGSDAAEDLRLRYGLFLGALFAPDLNEAYGHARRMLEVGERSGDPLYLLSGHAALGMVSFHRGELGASLEHCGRAAALADAQEESWTVSVLQAAGRATTRGYSALGLALVGKGRQAEAMIGLAHDKAQAAEHPFSIGLALVERAWVRVMLDDPEAALPSAVDAAEYAADRGLVPFLGMADVFRAWAMARLGDEDASVGLARAGRREVLGTGIGLLEHFLVALQAEVELEVGLVDDALTSIDLGLARVDATGDRFYEAELHRLRGQIIAGSGPTRLGDAEGALGQAAEVARRQGAATLEARAVSDLERLRAR